MQTIIDGTGVVVELCTCTNLPIAHAKVLILDDAYEPIFSKNGVRQLLQSCGFSDEELQNVASQLAELSLPQTHIFDAAAESLKPRQTTAQEDQILEELDSESEGFDRATFVTCSCKKHGFIYDHAGIIVSRPFSKKEALADLERLVEADQIRIEDRGRVYDQIIDSQIPAEPEIPEDPSETASFTICAICGEHGILRDHKGNVLSKPETKREAREDVEKFLDTGRIRRQDLGALTQQISKAQLD